MGDTAGGSHTRLLPRDSLTATSPVDHADWNYRPVLGALQRKRFELLLSLMGNRRFARLLEVGYGSGVLMPELVTHCEELVGVDPHGSHRQVSDALAANGVRANLVAGDASALPFADACFDGAVSVSALEYVEDIHGAGAELARVLRPDGVLIVVTPGHSRPLDLALRLTTGEDATENYGERRQKLVPSLLEHFQLSDERVFPPLAGRFLPLYRGLRLAARQRTPPSSPRS